MLAPLLSLLAAADPLTTVATVDLARYAGTWYEAARTPNRFQNKCVSDVQANYTIESPTKVKVVNQCRTANGQTTLARGHAKLTAIPAQLKVTFFWPFYGDYWIIDLDPAYRWAIVGEPGRKYLWFLTRDKSVPAALFEQMTASAAAKGYDTSQLIRAK